MPGIQVVEDMYAERFGVHRYQGFRRDDAHLAGMQKVECMDLRARHARVQDVADDRDPQAAEIRPLDAADGEHVEHGLGRMRMTAVTGVDDADVRRHMVAR